jgi:hypothetical protein
MERKTSLLEWWGIISKERCDNYAHSQEDNYNEALKVFLQYTGVSKSLDIKKPNPRR